MPISPQGVVQSAVSGSQGVFDAAGGFVTLLQANAVRKGATFYNAEASSAWWYIHLGMGAGLSNFTVNLHPGDYYEMPFGYTGQVDAWPSTLTGSLQVEELV
jgi:hypothetical protein